MASHEMTFNPYRFDFKPGDEIDYYFATDSKMTNYDIYPAKVLKVNKYMMHIELDRPLKGKKLRRVYKVTCTPRGYGLDEVEL